MLAVGHDTAYCHWFDLWMVDIHENEVSGAFLQRFIKRANKFNTVVAILYRPPDQNLNIFVDDFNAILEKICVIMCDLNIRFMNHQCHNKTGEFVDSFFFQYAIPSYYSPNYNYSSYRHIN